MRPGQIKHGLVRIEYPGWNGGTRDQTYEVSVYAPDHGFDLVKLDCFGEPLWRQRGTWEKSTFNPYIVEGFGGTKWGDPSAEPIPQKDFSVWTDGGGVFKDLEDFYEFLKRVLRAKVIEEVWEESLPGIV